MKKAILMSVLMLLISPVMANADVTVTLYIGQLLKQDGTTPFGLGSTLALLADADNDGFGQLNQGNTWSTDTGDVVLGSFQTNDFLGDGTGTSQNVVSFSYNNLSLNDPLMLVFYDTPFIPSSTGAGGGVNYGFYRSDSPDALLGGIGWLTPADGSTVDLFFITQSFEGSAPNAAGIAQFQTIGTVVPEPVSSILALIGGGAMAFRRRFLGASV